MHDVPGDNQCRAREHTALTLRHATLDLLCDPRATADELPALLDDSSDEDEPVSGVRIDPSLGKPDFFVTLTTADELPALEVLNTGVHYDYALDSLYENDMLEWVPVAPGEQSLYEQTVAAARALAASRARELSHKRKQRGSAPPAAVAVASWRRYR